MSIEDDVRDMADNDVTDALREWCEGHPNMMSEVIELQNDYLYDREVCKAIGANYNDPSSADYRKVLLYAAKIVEAAK